jgi:tetratricopeptide (TPR) repeat protein
MPRTITAIRWPLLSAIVGISALGGWIWWSWGRLDADPLVRGRAAYERGDWAAAEDLAREQLRVASGDADGLRLMARASARLGRDDFAASLFNQFPDPTLQAEDSFLVGLMLRRKRKLSSAVKLWERARSLDPKHAETLFELTRAYLASDRLDDAARSAAELSGRPDWESRAEALLGSIQLERNDPDGAATSWRRALDRPRPTVSAEGVPDPIVPHTELARALLLAGRPADARDQLRLASAGTSDPEAAWLLSRAEIHLRDWSAARAALERSGSFRADHPTMTEPGPYVGALRCAGCHPAEFRAQQNSRHARTFFRASELGGLALPAAPVPDPSDRSVVHALRRDADGRIHQQTEAAGRLLKAVVQYAFGSGDRGLTLVGRDPAGHAYELRLSDYSARQDDRPGARDVAHWDVTTGHPPRVARAEEFLGQPLSEDSVRRCLSCHVTDPKAIADGAGACASDRAISCERCHGPGVNHLLALEGKLVDIDLAIARPTMATGPPIVELCAQCHSPRGHAVFRDDPTAIRFQGTTLTWSRCYSESNDALDCVTCHDPHRDASTSAAHYEAKCLECHSRPSEQPPATGQAGPDRPRPRVRAIRDASTRTSCPVSPSTGCIGCHMPAVGGVVPHSTFTDHFIRVHRD